MKLGGRGAAETIKSLVHTVRVLSSLRHGSLGLDELLEAFLVKKDVDPTHGRFLKASRSYYKESYVDH